MNGAMAAVLNTVRTRLTQLVPHVVDRALSQLPAKAAAPAQRLFAQSKLVVNRLQPPPPDSELSTQLEWTFKADVHSAAALSASIASTMADRERYALLRVHSALQPTTRQTGQQAGALSTPVIMSATPSSGTHSSSASSFTSTRLSRGRSTAATRPQSSSCGRRTYANQRACRTLHPWRTLDPDGPR